MTSNKENKEVGIIDPNPNSSYKTKKNFTGFYTEVNPLPASSCECNVVADTCTKEGWKSTTSKRLSHLTVLWGARRARLDERRWEQVGFLLHVNQKMTEVSGSISWYWLRPWRNVCNFWWLNIVLQWTWNALESALTITSRRSAWENMKVASTGRTQWGLCTRLTGRDSPRADRPRSINEMLIIWQIRKFSS